MQDTNNIALSTLDWIAIISSIASLILAVLSIWLALHFYSKAKEAESSVAQLLIKLDTQTNLIHKVTSRMLDKYVTFSTSPKAPDESWLLMAQIVQSSLSQGLPNNSATESEDRETILQHLTTLYIATMYYSAIANIYLQITAPDQISDLEPEHKTLLERSSSDFRVSSSWIDENGNNYIGTSSAAGFYKEAVEGDFAGVVRDPTELYMSKQQDE
jgi:hypothetical protein